MTLLERNWHGCSISSSFWNPLSPECLLSLNLAFIPKALLRCFHPNSRRVMRAYLGICLRWFRLLYLSISDRYDEPFIHQTFHSFDDILQFITSYQSTDSGNMLEAVSNENVSRHKFKPYKKMTCNSIWLVIKM